MKKNIKEGNYGKISKKNRGDKLELFLSRKFLYFLQTLFLFFNRELKPTVQGVSSHY